MSDSQGRTPSAVTFHGSWIDFAKIALPNVLLTLVTLGIYRFWATTRERNYLWSKTRFIDEPLEWTGTGMELFIGFIMVFFLLGLPLVILQLVAQGMIFQGQTMIAAILVITMVLAIYYLTGVAYFRTLRYRLSRTYWRGIRGGSDDQGLTYGFSYIWKNFAAAIPLFLLYPWASISLWNERWNLMSFGPYRFESNARWTDLMKRYLLFYLVPFLIFAGIFIAGVSAGMSGGRSDNPFDTAGGIAAFTLIIVGVLAMYILVPIAALMYYSKFFRVAVGGLRLGNLEFEFKARSPDWILYWLGNIAIMGLAYGFAFAPFSAFVFASPEQFAQKIEAGEAFMTAGFIISALIAIIPLAFAASIIRYRAWKFFAVHMEAYGEVNLDHLTQSETEVSSHGEGLLDAFDVGAM